MKRAASMRGDHLRLVKSGNPLPSIMTDPAAKAEFDRLTQRLVDVAVEITNLAAGDADLEWNDDEFEDDDPREDSDGS